MICMDIIKFSLRLYADDTSFYIDVDGHAIDLVYVFILAIPLSLLMSRKVDITYRPQLFIN